MDSKDAFWGRPAGQVDVIDGDRRQDRRYHLQLELKWKLIRRRRVLDTGTGHTLDVSSGGILFDAGRHSARRAECRTVDCVAGTSTQCRSHATGGARQDHPQQRPPSSNSDHSTRISHHRYPGGTVATAPPGSSQNQTHNPPMLSSAPMLAACRKTLGHCAAVAALPAAPSHYGLRGRRRRWAAPLLRPASWDLPV